MFASLSVFSYGQTLPDNFYDWVYNVNAKVPKIYIDIEDEKIPQDKTTFLDAQITVIGNEVIPSADNLRGKIKGRGNSSWKTQKPKKKILTGKNLKIKQTLSEQKRKKLGATCQQS